MEEVGQNTNQLSLSLFLKITIRLERTKSELGLWNLQVESSNSQYNFTLGRKISFQLMIRYIPVDPSTNKMCRWKPMPSRTTGIQHMPQANNM